MKFDHLFVVAVVAVANSRKRFFRISWLSCEQYGKNKYKKKKHNQHSSVFTVLKQLSYYLNVT